MLRMIVKPNNTLKTTAPMANDSTMLRVRAMIDVMSFCSIWLRPLNVSRIFLASVAMAASMERSVSIPLWYASPAWL